MIKGAYRGSFPGLLGLKHFDDVDWSLEQIFTGFCTIQGLLRHGRGSGLRVLKGFGRRV